MNKFLFALLTLAPLGLLASDPLRFSNITLTVLTDPILGSGIGVNLEVSVEGGTADYTYSLGEGRVVGPTSDTTVTFSNLPLDNGVFTGSIEVQDASDASISADVSLLANNLDRNAVQNSNPQASFSFSYPSNGLANGEITITNNVGIATAEPGAMSILYSLNNEISSECTNTTMCSFSQLEPGTYSANTSTYSSVFNVSILNLDLADISLGNSSYMFIQRKFCEN